MYQMLIQGGDKRTNEIKYNIIREDKCKRRRNAEKATEMKLTKG